MIKVYLNTLEETTKALQDGKVVYVNNDGNQFKLINGIVCRFNRGGNLKLTRLYQLSTVIFIHTNQSS